MEMLFTWILVSLLLFFAPVIYDMFIKGCVSALKTTSRITDSLWTKLTGQKGRKKVEWSTTSRKISIPDMQKQLIQGEHSFYNSSMYANQFQAANEYGVVKNLETELLTFASDLYDKELSVDFLRNRPKTEYTINGYPFCIDIIKYEDSYSVYLMYGKDGEREVFCSASFPLDGNRIDMERVLVLYGYKEFHHGITQVYNAFVNHYLRSLEKNERYHRLYEPVNEENDEPTLLSTTIATPAHADQPAFSEKIEKVENEEIQILYNDLLTMKERLSTDISNLSVEIQHRLSIILADCDDLLNTYRSLTANNETIEKQVLLGLQVAVEKLTEIQGTVDRSKEHKVLRRVEVLKQR